jgi:hypothetical protein
MQTKVTDKPNSPKGVLLLGSNRFAPVLGGADARLRLLLARVLRHGHLFALNVARKEQIKRDQHGKSDSTHRGHLLSQVLFGVGCHHPGCRLLALHQLDGEVPCGFDEEHQDCQDKFANTQDQGQKEAQSSEDVVRNFWKFNGSIG